MYRVSRIDAVAGWGSGTAEFETCSGTRRTRTTPQHLDLEQASRFAFPRCGSMCRGEPLAQL